MESQGFGMSKLSLSAARTSRPNLSSSTKSVYGAVTDSSTLMAPLQQVINCRPSTSGSCSGSSLRKDLSERISTHGTNLMKSMKIYLCKLRNDESHLVTLARQQQRASELKSSSRSQANGSSLFDSFKFRLDSFESYRDKFSSSLRNIIDDNRGVAQNESFEMETFDSCNVDASDDEIMLDEMTSSFSGYVELSEDEDLRDDNESPVYVSVEELMRMRAFNKKTCLSTERGRLTAGYSYDEYSCSNSSTYNATTNLIESENTDKTKAAMADHESNGYAGGERIGRLSEFWHSARERLACIGQRIKKRVVDIYYWAPRI